MISPRLLLAAALCLAAPMVRAQTAPVPAPPAWEKLRAAYDYDAKKPLDVKETALPMPDAPNVMATHLTLAGKDGAVVPGVFARPKTPGIVPVVILLHGLTSDKETMLKIFGLPLVAQGFAVLALDAPHHGERRVAGEAAPTGPVFAQTAHDGVVDWRRGLDYLGTRKDVDGKRIGLLGYSMGSIMGSILCGVDTRIQAAALCVGGDPLIAFATAVPDAVRPTLYAVSPSLYIGHIAPRPILMLNGTSDTTITAEASSRLYAAAREPKQQVMFASGHMLPKEAGEKAVAWLTKKLKTDGKKKTETGKVALPGARAAGE